MRRVSAKVFGNEKYAEVVCALDAEGGTATAQMIAKRTGIDHPMARDVLVRLAEAGVATPLPRAGSRAPLYYKVEPNDPVWLAIKTLACTILSDRTAQSRPGPAVAGQ
ncbi:MAG: hypothetical protein ACRDRG_17590 [Pseudonocardiaceae bacterium]